MRDLMGGLDKKRFELWARVSTPLIIASPSINFTSHYWLKQQLVGETACVCVCVPSLHPPCLPTGPPARPQLFQECVEHGCRDEGAENGTAGTPSDRGALDPGAGHADRGHAHGEPRGGSRGAGEAQPDSRRRNKRGPPEPQLVPGPGNHHQREAHRAGY